MSIEIRELNIKTELVNSFEPSAAEEMLQIEQRIIKRLMSEIESVERKKRTMVNER